MPSPLNILPYLKIIARTRISSTILRMLFSRDLCANLFAGSG